jgi:hypothetical protein
MEHDRETDLFSIVFGEVRATSLRGGRKNVILFGFLAPTFRPSDKMETDASEWSEAVPQKHIVANTPRWQHTLTE